MQLMQFKCDKMIYPNIYNLLKIFAMLPGTTCFSERSFSTLRLLKTYLRSTMTPSRLNGLDLLYVHKEINITTTEVIQEVCKTKRKLSAPPNGTSPVNRENTRETYNKQRGSARV